MEHKPDYYLNITLEADGIKVEDIPCKFYLPVRVADAIELQLLVNKQQGETIGFLGNLFWKSVLHGEQKHGMTLTRVRANTVYITQWPSFRSGGGLYEIVVKAEPADLEITDFHYRFASNAHVIPPEFLRQNFIGPGNKEESNVPLVSSTNETQLPITPSGRTGRKAPIPDARKTMTGTFWLTPNSFFNPWRTSCADLDGSVKVKSGNHFGFTLANGQSLAFDNHARWTHTDEGDEVQFREQVATFRLTSADHKSAGVDAAFLGELDDFLLLASVATRWRTVCLGWNCERGIAHTKHFRRGIAIPRPIEAQDVDDALAGRTNVRDFLVQAYPVFAAWPEDKKESVRQAMQRVLLSANRDLESGFVMLYAALETLVGQFRRESGLADILKRSQWDKTRRAIKELLKEQPSLSGNDENMAKLEMMLAKVPELNRPSFHVAFENFCQSEAHLTDVSDLWPVIGPRSLTAIRNELVHGETFVLRRSLALSSAKSHLQWVVERMLLSIFGWPVANSNVNPNFLRNFVPYVNWHEDEKVIFELS